jgi:TolB-like protein
MKKYSNIILTFAILIFITSCQPAGEKLIVQQPTVKSVFYLPAEVIEVKQNIVTVRVEKPSLFEGEVKFALQLAQDIIESTYLLEGQKTALDQTRVEVMRVMQNDILLKVLDKSHSFSPGDRTQIFLEKKIIAIRDFEVIMGRNKEVAKYVQEDITTALVNSGQFNVVERLKLQSVLDELKLAQLGLTDPEGAKQIGKLLGANVILTGTLAATGEEWNVNLRLINTETGLITSAFNRKGSLHEIKTESYRNLDNISENFEDETKLMGWMIGDRVNKETGRRGYQKVHIDQSQGANGTSKSLAMKFKLGTDKVTNVGIHAKMRNRLKRDLSNYSGIQFFMKADRNLTVTFQLGDSEEDSPEEENWYRNVSVSKGWKEFRIPFRTLSVAKRRAIKFDTNQILQLNYIERIDWVVTEHFVPRGTEGTVWLDEVAFY